MSFHIALTGLRGAQSHLSSISNNIANVGTNGFKRSRVAFGDIRPPAVNNPGIGTSVKSVSQQFTQGGYENTARDLDIAIAGNGFLVTRTPGDAGSTIYTRNGALNVDLDRYLVDSNGNRVQVLPVDLAGDPTANDIGSLSSLRLPTVSGSPSATTAVALTATLNRSADKPASRAEFAPPVGYVFDRDQPSSYNYTQTLTVRDSNGQPVRASLYFTRTASRDAGDATDAWDVRAFLGDSLATATPITLEFDDTGIMTAPTSVIQLDEVQPAGASSRLAISLDLGSDTRLTSGNFALSGIEQDGFSPSKFSNLSFSDSGQILATFADGTSQYIGALALANFSAPQGLRSEGNSGWSLTANSGEALIGIAGTDGLGEILAGALEKANVDLTEELVALIEAQRNFQANAKAIDTANAMDQAIINLQ